MIYLPDVDRFAVVFTTRRSYCRPETSDIQQIYAVNVLIIYAVTLGGPYDSGGAYRLGVQGHLICCSGRWLAVSTS